MKMKMKKRKKIKIDLDRWRVTPPEQPIVYLVTSGWIPPECIAEVYTDKLTALERAGEMTGWVVHTIDLEEE